MSTFWRLAGRLLLATWLASWLPSVAHGEACPAGMIPTPAGPCMVAPAAGQRASAGPTLSDAEVREKLLQAYQSITLEMSIFLRLPKPQMQRLCQVLADRQIATLAGRHLPQGFMTVPMAALTQPQSDPMGDMFTAVIAQEFGEATAERWNQYVGALGSRGFVDRILWQFYDHGVPLSVTQRVRLGQSWRDAQRIPVRTDELVPFDRRSRMLTDARRYLGAEQLGVLDGLLDRPVTSSDAVDGMLAYFYDADVPLSPAQRLTLAAMYQDASAQSDAKPAGYEAHIMLTEPERTALAERNFPATEALNRLLLQQAQELLDAVQLHTLSELLDTRLDLQRQSLARQQRVAPADPSARGLRVRS